MNPFSYTKKPVTIMEAQNNINYWWYEGMECPPNTIEANWRTFIREMKREADRDMRNLLTLEDESRKVKA
jgi:hypothetical protein